MRDPTGVSRGSGFVAFSTPEEASRAVSDYNIKKTCQILLISYSLEGSRCLTMSSFPLFRLQR